MYKVDFKTPIHVYFIGIGGISMSGLAEILLSRGFQVSGSDSAISPLTEKLGKMGALIYYGQSVSHIDSTVNLVVYTAAIREDNPEWIHMKELGLPSLSRAEFLGQLMTNYTYPIAVSGTHGKTTTTSMIANVLMASETDPTLSIGGILESIGGNIRIGKSEYFVTEACEYTNSFLNFMPRIGIILNVEEDHMDFFKDIHEIRDSFHAFANLLPADGYLIINDEIEELSAVTDNLVCEIIRYGFTTDCDYYPEEISYDEYGRGSYLLHRKGKPSIKVSLGVCGRHNISNSLAAFALSDILGLTEEKTLSALADFTGTRRRFENKGQIGGVTVIDDYAHHPTEITATLSSAANYPHNTLWCIFQPHTYTRTKAFLKEFALSLSAADKIILADIYAAREKNTFEVSSLTLKEEIEKLGKECYYFPTFDEIETFLLENAASGDIVITMGAGDIVKVGEMLLGK